MVFQRLLIPALTLGFAASTFAQTDSCTSPTAISGVGTHAFSTTAFTTSGFNGGGTCAAGASSINQDGFFQWTATAAGDYVIDTNTSGFDTKLSVHSGSACGATCLAYDDDGGIGLQSLVLVPGVTVGSTYLIQVGGYGTASGQAVLNIGLDPCSATSDDAFENNDDCSTATPLVNGTYTGLVVKKTDKDHYAFCLAAGATVTCDMLFATGSGDLDFILWDASDVNCGSGYGTTMLANGFSTTDNENLSWTNTGTSSINLVLEVNVWTGTPNNCNTYDLVIAGAGGCTGGSTGTPFCNPMNPNSTGASTTLTGSFGSGVGSGLHLEASSGPPNQFGYFLIGTASATPGIAVSQGRLCLSISGGNVFGRYNVPGGSLNSVGLFNAGGVL
ncbi:MAG TPA: hypothetical protein PLJ12_05675 [Planctomycetota bacterium]|nr:hypothetical protein [Planctomycetota bacterium]